MAGLVLIILFVLYFLVLPRLVAQNRRGNGKPNLAPTPENVEPHIYPLVVALNATGICVTRASCDGHWESLFYISQPYLAFSGDTRLAEKLDALLYLETELPRDEFWDIADSPRLGYLSAPVERHVVKGCPCYPEKLLPCVVREFPHQVAELEALLLENASRFKTIEQKVREAQAWKDVETEKSRARQLSKLRQNSSTPVTPDLASREKGETREKVAKLVGLKRTTYEKAAKVVRAIDTEINQGNLEHAIAL